MIGKCLNCHETISEDDIEDIYFRGKITKHYAYVCRKCGHIISIGMGAYT